jgi:23S rRNA (adenine2503-C2)-methyltransferase
LSETRPVVICVHVLSAIQAQLPEEVASQLNLNPAEVRRALARVHQRGEDHLAIVSPQISRRTREALAAAYCVGRLNIIDSFNSSLDPFAKFVCGCEDGELFETVRIPLQKAGCYSVCVSSQIGCGCGCRFCKTAELGLVRNLEAWQIVEQVRIVRRTLPQGSRLTGVVFQGMGEPLANLEAVIRAIKVLSDPCGQCIDQKAITVCTVGLPAALRRLAQAKLRIRVGLSIGSARPELRRTLMPIEARCPLRESVEALIDYTRGARQSPMLSYTLIKGVNTHPEDAHALRELALKIGADSGRMPRLSLVPYNSRGPEDPFRRADEDEAESFRLSIAAAGFPVVRRYSGGADISAACGQLAATVRADST